MSIGAELAVVAMARSSRSLKRLTGENPDFPEVYAVMIDVTSGWRQPLSTTPD
jgi:hypothetical protein